MLKIEYEIKLNESGRPCIELSPDYEHRPEDKFFAIEMARYFLQVTHARMTVPPYDQNTIEMTDIAIRLLGQIGDEMAEILWNDMKTMGEIDMVLKKAYYFAVDTVEDLDKINQYYSSNDRIYKRSEGLKVLVRSNSTVYVFSDEKWSEVNEKTEGS